MTRHHLQQKHRLSWDQLEKTLPVTQATLDDMAMFTTNFVYTDKISKTLGDARARKWTKMKRKSTLRLPPDRDSHDLKMKRVNYQAFTLLNYDKADSPPSPLNHGWSLEKGKCITMRYAQPALPKHLNEVLRRQAPTNAETLSDSGESDSDDNDDNWDNGEDD